MRKIVLLAALLTGCGDFFLPQHVEFAEKLCSPYGGFKVAHIHNQDHESFTINATCVDNNIQVTGRTRRTR